jgi:hypothetical protein
MSKPTTIEDVAKKFNNDMALQLTPSNDTMKAVRLAHKMVTELLQSQAEKYEREKREILDFVLNELEDDMELVAKEIDRLRERDEEGDDYRRYAHVFDYAMLKHTRNTIAQKYGVDTQNLN